MRQPVLLSLLPLTVAAALLSAEAQVREEPSRDNESERSIYLGILGDSGTGKEDQRAVANQLALAKARNALDYVILLGDNIYNNGEARFIRPKYLDVYGSLLDDVAFHAALGNHDVRKCDIVRAERLPRDAAAYEDCDVQHQLDPKNRFGYRDGNRYYTLPIGRAGADAGARSEDSDNGAAALADRPLVEVFVLDSNTLDTSQSLIPRGDDRAQLEWLDESLGVSRAIWKVAAMHHPMHSPRASGWFSGHAREERLEEQIESILVEHDVDVVFAGHNHFYARMVPQDGIRHFVAGGGGRGVYRYRREPGYVYEDEERGKFHHFVHVRVSESKFEYCTVDADGNVRDSGWFGKDDATDHTFQNRACPY